MKRNKILVIGRPNAYKLDIVKRNSTGHLLLWS